MRKNMEKVSIVLLAIFVFMSISFGWNQMASSDPTKEYCFAEGSWEYGDNCDYPRCDKFEVIACDLAEGEMRCCEYAPPGSGWYCQCMID